MYLLFIYIFCNADMVERRAEVVGRMKMLEESAAPLISFLQNPSLVQELRSDKQSNLQMLNDRFQVFKFYFLVNVYGACYNVSLI